MTQAPHDNPTRAFVADAIERQRFDVALDSNPFLQSMATRLLGGRSGEVKLGFTAGPQTLQGNGVIGGGALAQMLDMAMAVATLSTLPVGQTCATISMTTQMQRPAAPGSFTAVGKVERTGKRVAFTTAQLFDAAGKLVASSSSSLSVLPEPGPT
jgi:uncharacterized protein (TIGR00369 family)